MVQTGNEHFECLVETLARIERELNNIGTKKLCLNEEATNKRARVVKYFLEPCVYLPISDVLMNSTRPEDNARGLQNSVLVATWHKISVTKERQKVVRQISFSSRMPQISRRATCCSERRSNKAPSVRYISSCTAK